jgi:hypothetical protein
MNQQLQALIALQAKLTSNYNAINVLINSYITSAQATIAAQPNVGYNAGLGRISQNLSYLVTDLVNAQLENGFLELANHSNLV